jgi:hypothetical protein
MTTHNTLATEFENAKSLATDCRAEIITEWMESGGDRYADLDDMIYTRAHEEADRLCIYTHDNRMLLRTLEDAGVVDDYTDLLCGDEDHERRIVVIAYTFWCHEIGAALHELFAEVKSEVA